MQCPQCQYENLPDAAFCQECGAKLQSLCSQCQTENLPTAKFCRKCGAALTTGQKGKRRKGQKAKRKTLSSDPRRQTPDARPASYTPKHLAEHILAEQAAMEARGAADGERKTITALFADIKGSMEPAILILKLGLLLAMRKTTGLPLAV